MLIAAKTFESLDQASPPAISDLRNQLSTFGQQNSSRQHIILTRIHGVHEPSICGCSSRHCGEATPAHATSRLKPQHQRRKVALKLAALHRVLHSSPSCSGCGSPMQPASGVLLPALLLSQSLQQAIDVDCAHRQHSTQALLITWQGRHQQPHHHETLKNDPSTGKVPVQVMEDLIVCTNVHEWHLRWSLSGPPSHESALVAGCRGRQPLEPWRGQQLLKSWANPATVAVHCQLMALKSCRFTALLPSVSIFVWLELAHNAQLECSCPCQAGFPLHCRPPSLSGPAAARLVAGSHRPSCLHHSGQLATSGTVCGPG